MSTVAGPGSLRSFSDNNNHKPASGLFPSCGLYLLWRGDVRIWIPRNRQQLSGSFLNTHDAGHTCVKGKTAVDGDHTERKPCSFASEIFLTAHGCKLKRTFCCCQRPLLSGPPGSPSHSGVLRFWAFHSRQDPSGCELAQDGSGLSGEEVIAWHSGTRGTGPASQ